MLHAFAFAFVTFVQVRLDRLVISGKLVSVGVVLLQAEGVNLVVGLAVQTLHKRLTIAIDILKAVACRNNMTKLHTISNIHKRTRSLRFRRMI